MNSLAGSQNRAPQQRDVIDALNQLARSHYDWTAESFVRVLTLAAWREDRVSSRIDAEYRQEIPRLYRLIERIDELGGHAAMNLAADYAVHLPHVGKNLPEMLAREQQSLGDFQLVLGELAERLTAADEKVGAAIAREAQQTRADYLDWIANAIPNDKPKGEPKPSWDRDLAPAPPEAAEAWTALLRLYAQLSPAIEETVVHMLLLQRAGQEEAASSTWRDSWAYMLYAAEVVRLLAQRGWAMDFRSPAALQDLPPPAVATAANQATASNDRRRNTLAQTLSQLATTLADSADSEAHTIARNAANYVQARTQGKPGAPPRDPPNVKAMLKREKFNPQ